MNSIISGDLRHGRNFTHGRFCVIEPDVMVGDDVSLGNYVMLKSGTRIHDRVELADYCKTTGLCIIGSDVKIRTESCISKGVIVDDWVFIGAGIMTSHTKHVYHGREHAPRRQLVTRIGYGAVIGSRTNMVAGVEIAPGAVVGYHSSVVKSLLTPHAIYLNFRGPTAEMLRVINPGEDLYIELPERCGGHLFDPALLERYLPYA